MRDSMEGTGLKLTMTTAATSGQICVGELRARQGAKVAPNSREKKRSNKHNNQSTRAARKTGPYAQDAKQVQSAGLQQVRVSLLPLSLCRMGTLCFLIQ